MARVAVEAGSLDMLSEWIELFQPLEIPAATRRDAALLLLDAIGCAASSRREETVERLKSALPTTAGPCTVIGGPRVSLNDAILLNGASIRTQDLNDVSMGSGLVGHPSDNIAALLAVSEYADVSGRRFLEAMIICYELYCRVLDDMAADAEWDHTTASALAVPAGLAWALGLDRRQTVAALSLAACLSGASAEIRRGQISSAKSIANAVVSSSAATLTLMARSGLSGPSGALDGTAGWFARVFRGSNSGRLVEPLSGTYRISQVAVKAYPCIGTAQGAVAAASAASARFLEIASDVTAIELRLPDSPLVAGQIADASRRSPSTKESADHSIPYLCAAALLEGTVSHAQFARRMWEDSRVRGVMSKLTLSARDDLRAVGSMSAELVFRMTDGSSWTSTVAAPPGHPRNPLSASQVTERFAANCDGLWSTERLAGIVASVDRIDALHSIRQLTELLTSGTGAHGTGTAVQETPSFHQPQRRTTNG